VGFSKPYVSLAGERDGVSIWRVEKPLRVTFPYNGKDFTLIIPEGFITDFGSIPQLAQALFSPTDPELIMFFIFHDYLYEKNGRILAICDGVGFGLRLSRYESDLIPFWTMAKAEGVGYFKRSVIYNSVRVGGKTAWDDHKKLKKGDRFKLLNNHIQ
jgi:hypothetical protein